MTLDQLQQVTALVSVWAPFLGMAAQIGIRSWSVIHAMIQDAHQNDPEVAQEVARQLQPQWDDLRMRVARAAGLLDPP
jgi:type IV secretory pathway TrbD component